MGYSNDKETIIATIGNMNLAILENRRAILELYKVLGADRKEINLQIAITENAIEKTRKIIPPDDYERDDWSDLLSASSKE